MEDFKYVVLYDRPSCDEVFFNRHYFPCPDLGQASITEKILSSKGYRIIGIFEKVDFNGLHISEQGNILPFHKKT